MAFSKGLLNQRSKLQHEILALESTLGNGRNIADLLSSDSDSAEEFEDSGHEGEDVAHEDLEAERQQIQREIEELERTLGADAALVDALTDSEHGSLMDSNDEDSDEDLDLPQDLETCLQMNLVYQEVVKEKLAELERLLKENREQQKELEEQLSGPSYSYSGLPHLKLFLGSFMKPYFKDKLTGLGPPSNEETKERLTNGTKPCDEMKIRRWEPWQKTLLINSVVTDTMKRMLQPKLSKMEYLTTKMSNKGDAEKKEVQNQIALVEKEIIAIRSMREDQLYGARHDYHDWDKIANTDFEGFREPDDLMRFWQNYLHPSINKSIWSKGEIAKLEDVAETHMYCHWEQIAESLGTNRTAFMCFQTYQRYISKRFRKREWSKEEDEVLKELVDKMRIGNFIPYTQMSYFMEGRDSSQLIYRWTCVLDPSIKKGPWSKEEDQLLLKAVKKYGCKDWWKIKMEVPGRTDNACRDRYLDCLHADVKRGAWSDEEVELLKKLVEKHGVGKWAKIASEIPNRVDSQCLNKWKWMMQIAERGGKRRRRRRRLSKNEPQLKRRRMRQTNIKKEDDDFKTGSDASEDEKDQVLYTDSDAEQPVENVCLDEKCRLEYVQPDMKEWIPGHGKKLVHSSGKLKTTLVRLLTEAEESAGDDVRNTVLDRLGNPVKTYVGMEPPALQKTDSSSEHAMIMASECDVKRLLICMRASLMKARLSKNKTKVSSCTNQNDGNDEEEDKSEMGSSQRSKRKAVATTQINYDLMLAITPWVGNVVMPLSSSERRVCEVDIVRKRAENVPLEKSPVFLLFLQALKIDTDGCKKVIKARQDRVSSVKMPRPVPRPNSGSYHHVKTVADIFAERKEKMKQSSPLKPPEFLDFQLFPQPAKIAIPPLPRQQRKTKQTKQSASQKGAQPASQKGAQPASQKGAQPASQKDAQPASQKGAQPASQKDAQPAVKKGAQPAVKKGAQPASQKGAQPASQKGAQPASQKGAQPASQKGAQPAVKKGAQPAVKKGAQPADKKGAQPADKKGAQPADKKGAQPADKKGAQPADKKGAQPASQKVNVGLILPQMFVVTQPNTDNKGGTSSNNAVPGILPALQLGTQDASKLPQPVLNLAGTVKSERVAQATSCPTTSVSTTDPPTEKACTPKRKPKPTMKAQAFLDNKKSKLAKKEAAKKQQNSRVTPTLAVLPQTTAWVLTPAGLLPVTGIQIQAPGVPGDQNQVMSSSVQMIFQQPAIVNQSSCVAPTNDTRPSNPMPDLPNCTPSSVSDNHIVSSLPSSSNSPSAISAAVKNISQALPGPNVPTPITGSAAQDSPSKSACNQNKTVTPMNPMKSLVPGSSSPVGTSQNNIPSCSSDATNSVPSDSSVSAGTSNPSKPSVHQLNMSGAGTIPGPQNQRTPHPVSQVVFQQPIIVNQNGSLTLIDTAAPCIPNGPAAATANVTSVPTNSKALNSNKSLPTSSTEGAAISSAFCLIPTSALSSVLNGSSIEIPHSSFVNNPLRVNVGSLPTVQLGVNSISPMTTTYKIVPQTVMQQVAPQAKEQTAQKAASMSHPRPTQVNFEPSLMFFEQPAQVKNWLKGNGGITLPGLEENMPYLPPFVSSINTLTTLLKGRGSLLKSAVQLLPEELRNNSEEEAKVAAVRTMVAERFKDNKAYSLLKARFLSCFTLPALLATINPCKKSDALAQEDSKDKVKLTQFGDEEQLNPLESAQPERK